MRYLSHKCNESADLRGREHGCRVRWQRPARRL